ncbi:hypothetical protein M5K25_014802 [Dendrobium thyrsiflorum]|uniref:Uncharacterized protein n=1 Tax=Dendrobium thyrsiflorum TaxID=117978 RepID=A0ABD0UP98_DENTH
MNSKKKHEVEILAAAVSTVARGVNAQKIIDVGSGQGYLSQVLSFEYQLSVVAIDSSLHHSSVTRDELLKVPQTVTCQVLSSESLAALSIRTVDDHIQADGMGSSAETSFLRSSESDVYKAASLCKNGNIGSLVLAGLHACGDLSVNMLRAFVDCEQVKALINVGCCYNLVSEESSEKTSMISGFPLSNGAKLSGLTLGKNARDLACQSAERWKSLTKKAALQNFELHAFRATFQMVLDKYYPEVIKSSPSIGRPGKALRRQQMRRAIESQFGAESAFYSFQLKDENNTVNKSIDIQSDEIKVTEEHYDRRTLKENRSTNSKAFLEQPCHSEGYEEARSSTSSDRYVLFKEFSKSGLQHLGLESPQDFNLIELWMRAKPFFEFIGPYWSLRASLGPLLETYILLDRLLFLQEHDNFAEVELVPLFDPTLSPRNVAIVARKIDANIIYTKIFLEADLRLKRFQKAQPYFTEEILWGSVLGVKAFFSFLLLLCICNTRFKEMNSASLLKLCSFPPQNPRLLVSSSSTILASYAKSTYVPPLARTLGRARCEFDVKGNGALSSDTDLRAIERQKALEAAMNDINNSFGKGSVTRLGSMGGALVETFPSGCLTLDFALGGGLPKGRIVEIFGPESSGKTTLALHAIAEVQKLGGNAMLVDAEHAFDPAYSRALGVNIENLIVCQPDNGEMALEIADRMCRSGAIDLICVDSVSALTPRAEIEGEIGMQQIGLQARLMSQALRKMSGNASKAGCTLIFLNQIRYKIGVFYGNPEVTSGGIALKFFASLRLEIRPIGKIKSGDEDIGVRVRVRVQKSKVSRPYKQAEFEIIFGEGVGKLGCVLDCAETMDVVAKKGSWYSYGDQRLGQGRDKALQFLRENPLIFTDIEKAVKAAMTEGSKHLSLIAYGQSPPNFDDEIKNDER